MPRLQKANETKRRASSIWAMSGKSHLDDPFCFFEQSFFSPSWWFQFTPLGKIWVYCFSSCLALFPYPDKLRFRIMEDVAGSPPSLQRGTVVPFMCITSWTSWCIYSTLPSWVAHKEGGKGLESMILSSASKMDQEMGEVIHLLWWYLR